MFIADGLQGMPEAIRRVFPGSSRQRCLVHVGRNVSSGARRKDRQVILDDFKSVYSAIGGEGPAGPIRGEVVANLPIVQEVPDRSGAVLVLPLPKGSLKAPLHLKRGRGLPRPPQKEAEGQAGPPFPQERALPHSRRGGEIQQTRQEQEADRL